MTSRKTFWILFILALLFVGPMVAAWSLYTINDSWPNVTINYGQLIQPPRDFTKILLKTADGKILNQAELRGKWLLIYLTTTPCIDTCQYNLYLMRQIRTALGKDRERVQRLLITTPQINTKNLNQLITTQYAGTKYGIATTVELKQFFNPVSSDTFYLVDPLGNLMMSYSTSVKPKGLLADLTRLLKTSQIG